MLKLETVGSAGLLTFTLVLGSALAYAEEPDRTQQDDRLHICSTYVAHERYLSAEWGEFPVFTGSVDERLMFRLFVNAKTGSWTALLIRADGFSCVSAIGRDGQRDVGN